MSIEKNNNNLSDGHVTIKALSQLSGLTINEKVTLTSSGYKPNKLSNSGFDFMMRCELPSDANGYLMGIKASNGISASNTFYIKVESGVLTWVVGSSSYTKTLQEGVHDIGWVGGKPVYDNKLVSTSAPAVSAIHNQKMAICGVNQGNTYTFIPSITLYRVDINLYNSDSPNAESKHYLCRYYPVGKTLYNAMKAPEATLYCYNASGGQGTGTASGEPTYGVQLDDLRYITKSRYRDLVAILADDNGVNSELGFSGEGAGLRNADYPSVLSKTSESHNFAFFLGLSQGQSNIPIPDDYSATKQGSTNYELGELIKGRAVKWDLWNDAVKFGKWGDQASLGAITYMRFNIFKENTGEFVGKVRLEKFLNYDTSKKYPPHFDLAQSISVEYHNGYACTLNATDRLTGYLNTEYDYSGGGDENFVFPFNRESGGIGKVKLGNLPLWNYTRAEQQETLQGLEKLSAFGGGLLIKMFDPSQQDPWVTFATMIKTVMDLEHPDTYEDEHEVEWPMPLCSQSSQESINTFKINGFDCSSVLRDARVEQLKDYLSEICASQVRASMMLAKTTQGEFHDGVLVDCSKIVANKEGDLQGIFNNRVSYNHYIYEQYKSTSGDYDKHYDDRFVVGEQGGKAIIGASEYLIGIQGSNRGTMWGLYNSSVATANPARNIGRCVCIGFGLYDEDNESLYPMFSQGVSNVITFLEVIEGDENNGTLTEEVKDSYYSTNISSVALDEEIQAVSVYISEANRPVLDTSYTKETIGTTDVYKFYITPTSGAGSGQCEVKLNFTSKTKVQTEMEFDIYRYDVTDTEPILTLNVPMSGSATITGSIYNCKCNVRVRKGWSRIMINKYIGFANVISSRNNDYTSPFSYDTRWDSTIIQPWGKGGSVGGSIGASLFMWRDLTDIRSDSQSRPLKTISQTSQKAYPCTFHMRVFSKTTGPHAWNVMSTRNFDELCEVYYKGVSDMDNIRRIYFHNACSLIDHRSQVNSHVDAIVSLWPLRGSSYVKNDQIILSTSMNGKTILIYEEPLHEPKDEWDFETYTIGSETYKKPLVRFDLSGFTNVYDDGNLVGQTRTFDGKVWNGSNWATDSSYQCRVSTNVQWGEYTRLPSGTVRHGEVGNEGFFRIEVWNAQEGKEAKTGSIYYIDIINTPQS